MKIVSVGPAPPWRGGISHYHYAVVRELKARGTDVEVLNFARLYPRVFFPGTSAIDRARGAFQGVGRQLLRPMLPSTWKKGAKWVRANNPDAVLFHWWHPFFAPAYLGIIKRLIPGTPVGFICHNVESHERMPGGRWLGSRTLKKGDFFITGGADLASRLRRLKPTANIEVVLHPRYDLPYTEFLPDREDARRRLNLESSGPLFLSFGLVRRYKGLETLIEALALLPLTSDWTCLIAGEFYIPRQPYEEQIIQSGLEERVRIEDRYIPNSEVPYYFAAADLVVLPYHQATQSGVAALSFALHRPVLTTRVGSLPEMIIEGKNGWLVPPRDPVALAERLVAVVSDPGSARLPVCEGDTGLPGWSELADAVVRLAGDSRARL